MTTLTLGEKIAMATLIVGIIGIFAAWLQPTNNRAHRVVAALVLLLLVGIGAWIGVTISAANNPAPVTVTDGTTSTTGTTATTATIPTISYKAPPEQETTSTAVMTDSGTLPTSATDTASRKDSPEHTELTVTTASSEPVDPRRIIEQQWNQAMAFSSARRWTDAIGAWRQFINEHSGHNRAADREAFHRLGVAYEALELWPEASGAFERASFEGDQKATGDLMHLGHCYIQLHRWPNAVTVYKRVLSIDPSNQQARNSLYWAVKQQMPE